MSKKKIVVIFMPNLNQNYYLQIMNMSPIFKELGYNHSKILQSEGFIHEINQLTIVKNYVATK